MTVSQGSCLKTARTAIDQTRPQATLSKTGDAEVHFVNPSKSHVFVVSPCVPGPVSKKTKMSGHVDPYYNYGSLTVLYLAVQSDYAIGRT